MTKVENQLKDAEVVLITQDEAKFTFVVSLLDEDFSGAVGLNKRKYNEDTKELEEDQETYNRMLDILHERLGVSAENSIDLKDQGEVDLSEAESEIDDSTIQVYYDPDNEDRPLSLFEIKSFPRFDNSQITSKIAKSLEKAFKQDKELKGLPISDHQLKHQFQVPFKAYVDGEEVHYFVSQILDENENSVKTKYHNNQIQTLTESIEAMENKLDEVSAEKEVKLKDKIKKSQESLNQIIDRARNAKIREFKERLGLDLEEMMENEEVVNLQLTSVNKTALDNRQLKGEKYYYMIAKIVSEPHEEEELDESEDELA